MPTSACLPSAAVRSIVAAAFVVTAFVVTGFSRSLPAQPADDDRPDWQPYFRQLARSWEITPQSTPDAPLVLREPAVLRWSQPVRGGDDGALYVWLKDGEPAVVGAMFCWPHPDGDRVVANEFHSLLTEPLKAVREGEPHWTPEAAGVAWKPFDGAPPPAPAASQRLVQMRQLAARFRGEQLDDESGETWELRLLRQPLYRFDLSERRQGATRTPATRTLEAPGVLDGALFALAMGTDPEILVQIAARATDDGDRWHWALVSFSDRPLTAWLDDGEVWAAERARPTASTPYTHFNVARLVRPPEEDGK